MEEIKILKATENDIQDLISLFYESEQFHRDNRPDLFGRPTEDEMREMFSKFLGDSKVHTLMAKHGDTPVGFARYRIVEPPKTNFLVKSGQKQAFIDELVVTSAYRKNGLAKKIMGKIEAELFPQGICHIQLNVFSFNEPAQELYRSLGYTPMYIRLSKDLV